MTPEDLADHQDDLILVVLRVAAVHPADDLAPAMALCTSVGPRPSTVTLDADDLADAFLVTPDEAEHLTVHEFTPPAGCVCQPNAIGWRQPPMFPAACPHHGSTPES